MITIQELLIKRGLKLDNKVKLARHKETKRDIDLYELYRYEKEKFLFYQRTQWKDDYKGLDYIVSFIGEEGTRSRFIGVYKINSVKQFETPQPDLEVRRLEEGYLFEYEMEEVQGFEDLKEHVIIDWGQPAIQYLQKITTEKEVVEISPGFDHLFPGYSNVVLKFGELKNIIEKSYPEWKKKLSAVNCIYALLDNKTGKIYVGSTYNRDGIWGRWLRYVQTNGHGDNVCLIKLIEQDEKYANNFTFSILQILPINVSPDQAIKEETLFKKKLGAIQFGLNKN